MAGLRLTMPTTFSDTTLPVIHDDLAIPPAVATGVLGLWELNHSARPAASGAATGLVVPNVAYKEAAALFGLAGFTASPPAPTGAQTTAAQTAVDAVFHTDTSFVASTTGLFERSGKGGLHGIMSQVNNTAANQGGSLMLPSQIISYITANPTHSYFLSFWDAITRVATSGTASDALAAVQSNASAASNRLISFQVTTTVGGGLGVVTSQGYNAPGASYYEAAQAGYSGTIGTMLPGVFWGSTGNAGASQNSNSVNYNKHPSHIFYRLYLEDLTVSGRSFSQCCAADQAAYALAFSGSGRYAGDTYTAPSTLP